MDIDSVIAVNPDAPKVRTLTAHDRCDVCYAQGLVRYAMQQGDLVLCGHHSNAMHEAIIGGGGVVVDDDREILLAEEAGKRF